MLQLTIDNGFGAPVDYTQYVITQSIEITDGVNIPTLLSLKLSNLDNTFVVPKQSGYVQLYSTKHQSLLASGFVTNELERTYLGLSQRLEFYDFQHMEYTVHVTSDEWLLNVKSVPFLPAYVNQTMGQILRNLAQVLAPDFFDTSQIQDGDVVPYFKYDPLMKWSDLAKQFGDQARYRYKVLGRAIAFVPFGDAPLGVTYDDTLEDRTFDPSALTTSVLAVPPVNDAIVIGDVEPQTMWDDYFMGDGFTTNFRLRHQVFNGATNLLLQDDWTEATFSSSWTVQDQTALFSLAGGLNAFGNPVNLGDAFIMANNGVELGGHLSLQHGYFSFTDVNTGFIGSVFGGPLSSSGNCLCGYMPFVAAGDTLVPSPSGATDMSLQGIVLGAVATPILVKTKVNHQYLLTTQIDAKRYTRYNQIYRALDTILGDIHLPSKADVTFRVSDYDQTFPWNPPVVTSFTVSGAALPSFGQYVLLDPIQANLALNYSLLSQPPQALLHVRGLIGPTGAQLPPKPNLLGPDIYYQLGFGMSLAAATVIAGSGGDSDQLQFYSGYIPYTNDIPGVGAKIAFTSWEPGNSLARVQDAELIAEQSVVTGDDGLRTAVFSDLKPTPRTSEEAEWAAMAQIVDRSHVQYDGSYNVFDYFWNAAEDYPWTGRYLQVHSPSRNILHQNLFVRQVTTKVIEMHQEVLSFGIQFGQDLFLEKLLRRFIATPPNTFEPNDTAKQPTLQFINEVGLTFLPDLIDLKVTNITGLKADIVLGVEPNSVCEVRRTDWGWGVSNQNLVGIFTQPQFSLARGARDQIWYMRQVTYNSVSDNFSLGLGKWNTVFGFQPLTAISNFVEASVVSRCASFYYVAEIPDDQYAEVTMLAVAAGSTGGPVVRANASQMGYAAFVSGPLGVVGGSTVSVGPTDGFGTFGTASGLTINVGDTIRLTVLGNAWNVLQNGNVIYSGTGMTILGGSPGMVAVPSTLITDVQLQNFVGGSFVGGVAGSGVQTSRFTRAVRIEYPLIPTAPGLAALDTTDPNHFIFELAFTGDIRNIRGVEIRDSDNITVLEQHTVVSPADLNFFIPNTDKILGKTFYAYFFNLQWEYSTALPLTLTVSAFLPPGSLGPNLLFNPGFEKNTGGYVVGGSPVPLTSYKILTDAWIAEPDPNYTYTLDTNQRTGGRNGKITLGFGQTIAAGTSVAGRLQSPTNGTAGNAGQTWLACRGGDLYHFGGYASWESGLSALPSPTFGIVGFQILFADVDGHFISASNSSFITVGTVGFAGVSAYVYLDGVTYVPANASFMLFQCIAGIDNTASGIAFSTGGTVYQTARFDDCFLEKANRGTHGTYRPLVNPLTSCDNGTTPGGPLPLFVQSNTVTTNSSSTLTPLPVPLADALLTLGNAVFVSVSTLSITNTFSITDTLGNVYASILGPFSNTTVRGQWFFSRITVAGSATLHVASTVSGVVVQVSAYEYSGIDVGTPVQQTNAVTGSGTAIIGSPTTITEVNSLAYQLLVSKLFGGGISGGITVPSPWHPVVTSINPDSNVSWQTASTGAIVRSLGTVVTGTANWVAGLVVFNPGLGGSSFLGPEIDIHGPSSPTASWVLRSGITDVRLSAGVISGAGGGVAYNTLYYVYYDDPDFVGGNVTYHATTVKEIAILGENRFFIGSILTPKAGGQCTVGNNDGGSGAQVGMQNIFVPSNIFTNQLFGNATITTPYNMFDGDPSTYCEMVATGNGANNVAQLTLGFPAGLRRAFGPNVTLQVLLEVVTNNCVPSSSLITALLMLGFGDPSNFSGNIIFESFANSGTTPKQYFSLAVPADKVLTNAFVGLSVQAQPGLSSGQVRIRIYDIFYVANE